MASATDEHLRRLARSLAGRVAVRLGLGGAPRERGVGRLRRVPLQPGGDLDVDASLDALIRSAAGGPPPDPDELRATVWGRSTVALCLLVDRSGSMGGDRLATAALAAAAVALRAPKDHSVVVFNDRALVLSAQDEQRPPGQVVDDLLRLRGHGVTDLALALDAARGQLARSTAKRRVTLLLSDARPTAGPDPVPAARRVDELFVLAPAGDSDAARALVAAVGGRVEEIAGPSDVPRALSVLLAG